MAFTFHEEASPRIEKFIKLNMRTDSVVFVSDLEWLSHQHLNKFLVFQCLLQHCGNTLYLVCFFNQLSSWQIPTELAEMRKKQDGAALKEHVMLAPNTNASAEKGPSPISLSAPAVTTGGREATPLRISAAPGSASALDMIKKKLQDSGAPVTSSPVHSSGPVASELNVSRVVEPTVKALQSENSKDKLKDTNGDGNMSDSSSDSEDVDSGPTKEECIIQFKVPYSNFCVRYSLLCYCYLCLKVSFLMYIVRNVDLYFFVPLKFLGDA